MLISLQIMYSSVGISNFLSILSNSFKNELKFPDIALYIIIIQARIEFSLSFKAQTSKSFSLSYTSHANKVQRAARSHATCRCV